jgi:hypothetical protein
VQVIVRQADLERALEIMKLTGQGPVENC